MLVCHCRGVCDREIRVAVRAGARTLGDVAEACGAGTGCGGCQETVEEILSGEAVPLGPLVALRGRGATHAAR